MAQMTGTFESVDGNLTVYVENCAACQGQHLSDLSPVEQKTTVFHDGRPFNYWAACVKTGRIIMLRGAIGNSLDFHIVEDPFALAADACKA